MSNTSSNPVICFLSGSRQTIKATESYLAKRGFKIYVDLNPDEFIERITSVEPQYVFIPWDHPNPQIRQLPKTLYQICTGIRDDSSKIFF